MKTIHLGKKLHEALKIRAARENTTIMALVSTILWHSLGGVHHETKL